VIGPVGGWEERLASLEEALDRLEVGGLPDLPGETGELGEIPEALRRRAETVLERIAAVEGPLRARRSEVARRRGTAPTLSFPAGGTIRA